MPEPSPASQTKSFGTVVNPYPGLRAFDEADADRFFGREREVAAILSLLEKQQLVVVHGTSGCGKSSVVRAGVLPVFRLDALASTTRSSVIVVKPSDAGGPLMSLAACLEIEFPRSPSEQGWMDLLVGSPDWASDLRSIMRNLEVSLCLLIDQFEEVFSLHRSGEVAEMGRLVEFLTSLDEAAEDGATLGDRSLSVILTMRSDYLGHCSLWDGLAETVNRCQYLLPKLSGLGILRAIHEPARLAGDEVTAAVADRLLPVISREIDGLPIVQHSLMRCWNATAPEAGRRVIRERSLDAVGGPEHAMSNHAEEAFGIACSGRADVEEAGNWIIRSLSSVDTDRRIVRRTRTVSQLARDSGASVETVKAFVDVFRRPEFCLMMPYSQTELRNDTNVTISHESLLRNWERVSSTEFDESGRRVGLVRREAEDGQVWLALSVQGVDYMQERTRILSVAAAEQRLNWFSEIQKRCGWAERYPLVVGGQGEMPAAEQWGNVAALMKASSDNLERERSTMARLRRAVVALGLCLAIVMSGVAAYYFKKSEAAGRVSVETLRSARIRQEKALAEMDYAVFMSARMCLAHAGDLKLWYKCYTEKAKSSLGVATSRMLVASDADAKETPFSNYGGHAVKPGE